MMNSARILIMDNEPKERGRIESFLAAEGNELVSVATAAEAVEALRRDRYDLFFTDCTIPGVDALRTSEEARRINPDLAVVIMTAFATIETAVKAIKAGAYDYLPKPIDLEKLAVLVRRAAERQNLVRENAALREQLVERYRFEGIASAS